MQREGGRVAAAPFRFHGKLEEPGFRSYSPPSRQPGGTRYCVFELESYAFVASCCRISVRARDSERPSSTPTRTPLWKPKQFASPSFETPFRCHASCPSTAIARPVDE